MTFEQRIAAKVAKAWTPEARLLDTLSALSTASTHLSQMARETPWAAQDAGKALKLVEAAEQVCSRDIARQLGLPSYG